MPETAQLHKNKKGMIFYEQNFGNKHWAGFYETSKQENHR